MAKQEPIVKPSSGGCGQSDWGAKQAGGPARQAVPEDDGNAPAVTGDFLIVTDPSGKVLRAMNGALLENGCRIMVFSASDMEHSHAYNPFSYVYSGDGRADGARVASMITMFQKNAAGMRPEGDAPFWIWNKSAEDLLMACAMYLLEFAAETERDMYHMLRLVRAGKASEGAGPSPKTSLDRLFDRAREQNPDAGCFAFYDMFSMNPAETKDSVLISAAAALSPFGDGGMRGITSTRYRYRTRESGWITRRIYDLEDGRPVRTDDNIDMQMAGGGKAAVFVNIPPENGAFGFLVSMMHLQAFGMSIGMPFGSPSKPLHARTDGGDPIGAFCTDGGDPINGLFPWKQ